MKLFQLSEPASAELTAAIAWYEQQRIGLGRELSEAVVETIDLIRAHPRSARLGRLANRVGSFK